MFRVFSGQNNRDKLTLDVTIPANTTATVFLPAKSAEAITESGKPLAKSPGVKFLRMDGDRVGLEVGAGSHRFAAVVRWWLHSKLRAIRVREGTAQEVFRACIGISRGDNAT